MPTPDLQKRALRAITAALTAELVSQIPFLRQ